MDDLIIPILEIADLLEKSDFNILPISNNHIASYFVVPFFENHRDPFDKLILSTAKFENIPIISADEKFQLYVPEIEVIKG